MIDDTQDHLRAAARLRVGAEMKTPDALQRVAAIGAGFTTNDRKLPAIPGLRTL